MWASTLKALMINTNQEAGPNPGRTNLMVWELDTKDAAGCINRIMEVRMLFPGRTISTGANFENEFISDGVTTDSCTILGQIPW